MVDQHPFKSSRFDPYHGDMGQAPFQVAIDYARSRGGLVYWAHPESNYSNKGVQMGPVKLMTAHYPEALIETDNYTGFAALYGDNITATKAGMQWDRALVQYCSGDRADPVWGIAGPVKRFTGWMPAAKQPGNCYRIPSLRCENRIVILNME